MITQLGPGATVAGYRIESVLGRGGMGVVYLAEDLRLNRKVALKLIAPELAADPRFRERFLREAELAASLDHPHVLPVYGAGETDGQLWIAMRYVEGEDLDTLLAREGPLEPLRAVELVRQVGEALDAAHGRGLVHRDVKPANVLVAPVAAGEHCYLTDFGLARAREDETVAASSAHLSGTVAYAAPERLAGRFVDGRADVYSLGCVLFECLAGEPPFVRRRPSATVAAHIDEEPPSVWTLRPELPSEVDDVVAKALAKEPGERYATCGELCAAARLALAPAQPRRRSLGALAGVAALVVVALVAALAVALTRDGADAAAESPVSPASPASPTRDFLIRLDPAFGRVVARTRLDGTPLAIAADDRWVWVAADGTLSRIDPGSNSVTATFDLPPLSPFVRITAAGGDVLLVDGERVLRLAAGADAVEWVDIPALVPGGEIGLVIVAGGSLWLTEATPIPGQLLRVDPETGRVIARLGKDLVPTEIVGEDFLWAIASTKNKAKSTFVRVDTDTNEITPLSGLSRIGDHFDAWVAADGAVVGEGSVFMPNVEIRTVLRLDPRTGEVQARLPIPGGAPKLAAGGGALWLADSAGPPEEDRGWIRRYHLPPETPGQHYINLDGEPWDLEITGDSVWVLVRRQEPG
jgi:tRNA A-37 threonylcarbamoyl transferase component Bud32/streptogramin lyase